MQTIFILLLSIIVDVLNPTSIEKEPETVTISVTVPNVTSAQGKVIFGLHNEETFVSRIPLQLEKSSINDKEAKVVFKNIPAGEYAIICFHDKNNNGVMDFEPNGMPIENYGASNNVMNFGPPRYYDTKFEVSDKDVSLEIRF